MNRRKLLTRLAITLAALALIGYITYLLFALTNPDRLKSIIHESVHNEVASIEVPEPNDGKDASLEQIRIAVNEHMTANPPKDGTNGTNGQNGHSATYEQVRQAVGEYMQTNPPKDGKDGTDGVNGDNGKTPLLRCNVDKNRWEIRFSVSDTWQLLNGEKVKCVMEER